MSKHSPGDEAPASGRSSGPADSVAGQLRPPRFLDKATVGIGLALGRGIDRTIAERHRWRLRRVGQEHALDASTLAYASASATAPPRTGNTLEVLIDGSEALPRMAADMASRDIARAPDGLVPLP